MITALLAFVLCAGGAALFVWDPFDWGRVKFDDDDDFID